MSCLTVWLLSASALVNDEVLESSDSKVPPWPCKIWISEPSQRIDVLRVQSADNGFQPTEQKVEVECGHGAVLGDLRPRRHQPCRSGAVDEFQIPIADQVEIANRRLGPSRQDDVAVGVEVTTPLVALKYTLLTVPTRIPATRTVSPASSREASAKTAE